MSARGDWNVFADNLARIRQIEIGVRHTLRGRPRLREWTGDAILCTTDPDALPPGIGRPAILVSAGMESFETQTDYELEVVADIHIGIHFEEHRHEVEDDEASIKSVVHEIDIAIFANEYLQVDLLGDEALIDRIVGAETVIYDNNFDPNDPVAQYLRRIYRFRYTEIADTGVPA